MKNKPIQLLFIIAGLCVCLIPSVGMFFAPTNEAIGNERQVALPNLTNKDGEINTSYPGQLGDYFDAHFALRPQAITADAYIQSGLFGVSNIDTVVTGTDGWLYYTSTLNDYLGRNTLSQKEISAIVHNLGIIQSYTKSEGSDFLFTVAPNKNTLYPENMPYYYSSKVSDTHNRDLLNSALESSDIKYVNLFPVFENQSETLYFKRDSHWNNKGALLAYSEIMKATGKSFDDFSSAQAQRKKDFVGDLSKMLYPLGSEPEYNYYYDAEQKYSYVTDTKSVEDPKISTESSLSDGKLFMYRDSFGNALLPFFAGAYSNATFTKSFTMNLSAELKANKPDIFIMELVERNVNWLITQPPILPSPKVNLSGTKTGEQKETGITVKVSEFAPTFIEISGSAQELTPDNDSTVCVSVTDSSGKNESFECYSMKPESGEGFLAYIESGEFDVQNGLDISVIIKKGVEFTQIDSENVKIGGI